jgi:ribokinase
MADVVVVGQVSRDLVRVGGEQREMLGGSGANQAVALAQLGVPVALVGVVGDDVPGHEVLARATLDGVDIAGVVVRHGSEDPPDDVLLSAADVIAAGDQIASCQALVLQLRQPGHAVRAALDRVPDTAFVVTDGAPSDEQTREAALRRTDVVRADAAEAASLVGRGLDGVDDAREAAAELLTAGARLVALAVGSPGDLVAWRAGLPLGLVAEDLAADPRWADGEILVPLLAADAGDRAGAGDAFVAALTAALLGGSGPEDAAWVAAAAASLTAAQPGGRPHLRPEAVGEVVRRHRGAQHPG